MNPKNRKQWGQQHQVFDEPLRQLPPDKKFIVEPGERVLWFASSWRYWRKQMLDIFQTFIILTVIVYLFFAIFRGLWPWQREGLVALAISGTISGAMSIVSLLYETILALFVYRAFWALTDARLIKYVSARKIENYPLPDIKGACVLSGGAAIVTRRERLRLQLHGNAVELQYIPDKEKVLGAIRQYTERPQPAIAYEAEDNDDAFSGHRQPEVRHSAQDGFGAGNRSGKTEISASTIGGRLLCLLCVLLVAGFGSLWLMERANPFYTADRYYEKGDYKQCRDILKKALEDRN